MSTEQLNLTFSPRKVSSRDSQCLRVLTELKKGRRLTKWEIMHELRALNAGGRIHNLRHGEYDGVHYPIEKEWMEVKSVDGVAKVARYFLV